MSLSTSTVPRQWKEARIKPIPKVTAPVQHSDFRPISVTPVQTRMMERVVVREFLYPSFLTPPPSFAFLDQYAFRPTSSTSAAVISLLHTISTLIQSNPFVTVLSLDFSKAFDTVRHSTLLAKMTELELPVPVYNLTFSVNMLTALWSTGKSHQRRAFLPASCRGRALGRQRTPSQPQI